MHRRRILLQVLAGATPLAFSALPRAAQAQQPDLYIDSPPAGLVATYPDDRWLLPGQSTTQWFEVTTWGRLYCEEQDQLGLGQYLPLPITASVGAGSVTVDGSGQVGDIGCNYIGSPQSHEPVSTSIAVPLDRQAPFVESLLRQAAIDDGWIGTIVLDPVSPAEPFGLLDEGGDTGSEVDDNTATDRFAGAATARLLDGVIRFGGLVGHISGPAYVLDDSIDCGGSLELRGGTITFDLGRDWPDVAVPTDSFELVCATPVMLASGDYQLQVTGTQRIPALTVSGEPSRLAGKASFSIDWDGLHPTAMAVHLPPGHTAHTPQNLTVSTMTMSLPRARGSAWVQLGDLSPAVVGTLDEVTATTAHGRIFIVSRDAPLGLRFNRLELTRQGLVGTLVEAQYLRQQPVHQLDSRHYSKEGPRSNDVWLSGALAPGYGELRIDRRGVSGELALGTSEGVTAFPRGKLGWGGGALTLEAGAVSPRHLPIERYTLEQRTACPSCGSNGGTTRSLDLGAANYAANPGVAADGTLMTQVVHMGGEVGFGPIVYTGSANEPTFLRSGDLGNGSMLVLPGFRLPAVATAPNDTTTPAAALLGAWDSSIARDADQLDAFLPSGLALAGASSSKKGNGNFAGLNIGPEIYSDAQNQPVVGHGRSLAGTALKIAFPTGAVNVVDQESIPSNAGTKFVVRGTVTGVFNTNAATAPQPQVYGYKLQFTRFAFGLVDNTLAPATWIDGKVTVHGAGDFSVPFTSLGLECTGQLAGGIVDYARQTPQTLKAWKTPYDVSQIAFAPVAPETQCGTKPRTLKVGGALSVKALAKTVSLSATWSPAGLPGADTQLAPVQARLDATPGDVGWGVLTKVDGLELRYKSAANPDDIDTGWFEFGALMVVPFWDALDVTLRLQNVADGQAIGAAPSLVVPAGFTPPTAWTAAWSNEANAAVAPMFAVDWPDSGSGADADLVNALSFQTLKKWVVELGAKVKWKPRSGDSAGRFVASVPFTKDLKVVKLQAAVPYVTTTNTQYTFGADADLKKLRNLEIPQLKIDLKDPTALGVIDSFLNKVGVSGTPVSDAIGGLRTAMNSMSSAVKGLFGTALKATLKSVLASALDEILGLAASAVTKLQSTAQSAITAVFGPLRDLVDQAVKAVVSGPDQALARLYYDPAGNDLPTQIVAYAQTGNAAAGQAVKDTLVVVSQAGAVLGSANTLLSSIDARINDATQALLTLKSTLGGTATTALCALRNPALAPVIANADYSCGSTPGLYNILETGLSFLDCKPGNPLIDKITEVRNLIQGVTLKLNALAADKLQALVNAVAGLVGAKGDGLVKALGLVDGYAKLVNAKIDAAYLAIVGDGTTTKPGFCGKLVGSAKSKLGAMADKAKGFVETIRVTLGQAKGALDLALGSLTSGSALATFKTKVAATKALVAQAGSALQGLAAKYAAAVDDGLQSAMPTAQGLRAELDAIAASVSALVPGGGALKWCNSPTCSTGSFLGVIGQKLATPVYALLGVIETVVGDQLTAALAVIPLPSKDDLLKHLTTLIVDSPVLDEISQLVNENLGFLEDKANELVNMVLDQLTLVIQAAIEKFNAAIAAGLKALTAVFDAIPLQGVAVKGFADILGDQVMALQVDAHFDLNKDAPSKDEQASSTATKEKPDAKSSSATGFDAQMRVESWAQNGKAANCGTPGNDLSNAYDVSISASNLPIRIGGTDGLKISKLFLGFSLDGTKEFPLLGVFGGINTTGALKLGTFELKNIAFVAAVGSEETYIGARAQGTFESYSCEVAFLVGRACNLTPLKSLDPEITRFIPSPPGPFFGVYVHGGASVPIISGGCALSIGLGAEAALWVFDYGAGAVVGGLVGGSIFGQALCFVSIRGGIRIALSYDTGKGEMSGSGEFYAGGGLGFSCDPETWTSAAAIEADNGCATVDVSATATFAPLSTGPVHTSGID